MLVRRSIEIWIAGGLLALAVRGLPWRRMLDAIGATRSIALVSLAVLISLAQFATVWHNPYPFSRWDLYAQRVRATSFIEVTMVADGVEVGPLPLTQVAPPREPRTVLARINALVIESLGGSDEARRTLDATLEHFAGRVSGPAPDAIVIRRCVVREPTAEIPVRCEVELTTDLTRVED
jgi:hypothetical protein